MTTKSLPLESSVDSVPEQNVSGTLARVGKYLLSRTVVLFLTVVVAVWLTIFVANMGGYVDAIIRDRIDRAIMGMAMGGWLRDVPTEEKFEIVAQTRAAMEEAAGLNEPFLLRTVRWLYTGMTLDWGESTSSGTIMGGRRTQDVNDLIKDALPRTLLLFGVANIALFFTSLFLSLGLTRRRGGWLDKMVIALSPVGAVPAWAFGIVLNVIFLRLRTGLTTAGTFDAWPREFTAAYIPMVLNYMFLPFLSIFMSGFFLSVYTWRSLFLIYSQEDYVDMARAKGLPHRMLERRYILRPGLPAVLTSFALMIVVLWSEIIALEKFFNVAGIGRLFYVAIRAIDVPLILGLVVSFAYLVAITMFLLDIFYAIVDPRVRIASEGRTVGPAVRHNKRRGQGRLRLRWRNSANREGIEKSSWGVVTPRHYTLFERVQAALGGMGRWLRNSAVSFGCHRSGDHHSHDLYVYRNPYSHSLRRGGWGMAQRAEYLVPESGPGAARVGESVPGGGSTQNDSVGFVERAVTERWRAIDREHSDQEYRGDQRGDDRDRPGVQVLLSVWWLSSGSASADQVRVR
jgi:peptide/nickel transport system permease protein